MVRAILAVSVVQEEPGIDDPVRLANERRENVENAAKELRAQRVPIETEPPTAFRPD